MALRMKTPKNFDARTALSDARAVMARVNLLGGNLRMRPIRNGNAVIFTGGTTSLFTARLGLSDWKVF